MFLYRYPCRKKLLCFTITELLIVILILAIISAMAYPSFIQLINSSRVNTAVSLLHVALIHARSESIKRNSKVIICRSENADSLAPSCANGIAPTGWGTGWIVYADIDGNSKFDADDELIRIQSVLFPTVESGSILSNPHRNAIAFRATGQTFGAFLQFSINQPLRRNDVGINRYICIASGGRARVDAQPCRR